MAESLQHRSSLSVGGINAMSWIGQDGARHHRVVLEVRRVMVMPIDAARDFSRLLRDAIRDAEHA